MYNKIYVKLTVRIATMSSSLLLTLKSQTCTCDGHSLAVGK